MGRCINCKYWDEVDGTSPKTGLCNNNKIIEPSFGQKMDIDGAIYFSDYDIATFLAGEQFGCIHFTEKEG